MKNPGWFEKSYAEITARIDTESVFYFHEEEGPVRTIMVRVDDFRLWYHRQNFIDSGAPEYSGSDYEDYDLKYKDAAGCGDYIQDGWQFTATKEIATEFDFKLKDSEDTRADTLAYIYQGLLSVDSNSLRGDYVSLIVIDIDNVLDGGVDNVIDKIIIKKYMYGGEKVYPIIPPRVDSLSDRKKLPAGVYLRLTYTSISGATSDVDVILGVDYHFPD